MVTSQQYGIEPQQLLGYLQQNNQLPAVFADVRRGLTIAAAVEAATVSDTDGTVIETSEFFGTRDPQDAEDDGTDEADASSEEPSGDTK